MQWQQQCCSSSLRSTRRGPEDSAGNALLGVALRGQGRIRPGCRAAPQDAEPFPPLPSRSSPAGVGLCAFCNAAAATSQAAQSPSPPQPRQQRARGRTHQNRARAPPGRSCRARRSCARLTRARPRGVRGQPAAAVGWTCLVHSVRGRKEEREAQARETGCGWAMRL
eukprot:358961-Chlamydomonas_euryale.AAC.11